MIDELLQRNLPNIIEKFHIKDEANWNIARNKIKNIIQQEEYGSIFETNYSFRVETILEEQDYNGNKNIYKELKLILSLKKFDFEFPIKVVIPKNKENIPAFLYLSFYKEIPNKHIPVEEICDNNFAVISFCYEDVTSDDDNFNDGLARYFCAEDNNDKVGKIAIWAFAASVVMDYIQTIDEIDKQNVAIVGLSRLGKTALLAGALDDRFSYVISNESGQSGAALSRGKSGEKIKDIYNEFPYWFSKSYKKYIDNEDLQEFDQHFLLALIAPRKLYVASAEDDLWADPKSEFLSCVAVNPIYKLYNKEGIVYDDYPQINQKLHKGNIGYHMRSGSHSLIRYDWNSFIEYINKKIEQEDIK